MFKSNSLLLSVLLLVSTGSQMVAMLPNTVSETGVAPDLESSVVHAESQACATASASAPAAARANLPTIDLAKLIEDAEKAEDYKIELKMQLYGFLSKHKGIGYEALMAGRRKLFAAINGADKLSVADIHQLLTEIDAELEVRLNIPALSDSVESQVAEDLDVVKTATPTDDATGTQETIVEEEKDICHICHEDLENGAEIREGLCHHKIHTVCINDWLTRDLSHGYRCPICRGNFIAKTQAAQELIPPVLLPQPIAQINANDLQDAPQYATPIYNILGQFTGIHLHIGGQPVYTSNLHKAWLTGVLHIG